MGFGNDEIGFRFPVSANPTHPKPTSRMAANQMGDSARIAGKYLASECAGCVIEPRNVYLVAVKPMVYGYPEGSNERNKGGYSVQTAGVIEQGMGI